MQESEDDEQGTGALTSHGPQYVHEEEDIARQNKDIECSNQGDEQERCFSVSFQPVVALKNRVISFCLEKY